MFTYSCSAELLWLVVRRLELIGEELTVSEQNILKMTKDYIQSREPFPENKFDIHVFLDVQIEKIGKKQIQKMAYIIDNKEIQTQIIYSKYYPEFDAIYSILVQLLNTGMAQNRKILFIVKNRDISNHFCTNSAEDKKAISFISTLAKKDNIICV